MRAAILACLVAFAASACATDRISDADRLQIYRAHAGAPVKSFQYFGRLDGWTPLGDEALAVWTKPSEVYLLELNGRCIDLDFAQAISLTNQSGRVYSRFDKVLVLGSGANQMPCWIKDIRPVDAKAVRQAEEDMRQAQTVERDKA